MKRELPSILQEVEQSILILERAKGEIPEKITELEGLIDLYDAERQDLLHYAENVNVSASEGFMRFKELQEVSRKRRKAKIELEDLNYLLSRIDKRLFEETRLNATIKNLEHRKQTHIAPTYRAKVRTDLQERLNKSISKRQLHIK